MKGPPRRLVAALRALAKALALSKRPQMIIGGVAVIARGVPRLTRDIDATVAAQGTDLAALLAVFAAQDIRPRIDKALAFARESQVLLLKHQPSGVELDVSLAWLPFEIEAIAAAEPMVLQSVAVAVARAEDLVIYKAIAWRPQDRQDIERLLALHGAAMDLARVRRLVRELAEALEDPDRARELEDLLRSIPAGSSCRKPRRSPRKR